MATMTAGAHFVTTGVFDDAEKVTDGDDSTYGTVTVTKGYTDFPFYVGGFDFSSIPAGSTINSVTFSTHVKTDSSISFYLTYPVVFQNKSSSKKDGTITATKNSISGGKDAVLTVSDKNSIGTWTYDELCSGSENPYATYKGIGFKLRCYSLSHSSKNVSIYYVKVTVDYTPQSYTVATAVSPSGSGTVSGSGTYEAGSTVTLTASPSTGYRFVSWNDGNTLQSRTVTVTGDALYTASFAKKEYTIYLRDDDGNSLGSVTALHGERPVIATTPQKAPSDGMTYTFREWNTNRDGSGLSYSLNGLPAATASTTYFAMFDGTAAEPPISQILIQPNPVISGQGFVITVSFASQ